MQHQKALHAVARGRTVNGRSDLCSSFAPLTVQVPKTLKQSLKQT